jgi:hypothetical protein
MQTKERGDKVVRLFAGFPRKRGFSNIDRDDVAVI